MKYIITCYTLDLHCRVRRKPWRIIVPYDLELLIKIYMNDEKVIRVEDENGKLIARSATYQGI